MDIVNARVSAMLFAMQCLIDRQYTISQQHKSLTNAFVHRDWADFNVLREKIQSFEPCSTSKKRRINICKVW